ncbi:SDR family oxidoreductase [Streptomyces sp. MST-110588]|nr:SDR family oxidoreductase [Streptomyces sp. MST-110588]
MQRFTNKTALITGGSSGMGFATARRLLDEGAYVVITGRDQARLDSAVKRLDAEPERLLAVRADSASPADLDQLMRRIETWRGSLDVVFANAGVGIFMPSGEMTEADVDQVIDVNFKGTFFTITKAVRLMREGGAVVINSSWTQYRGLAIASVYAATKAAVHSLARTMGAEFAPRGIRVNSVSPGYIDTEMYRDVNPDRSVDAQIAAAVPLEAIGHADEVAAAVAFLASDDASYVTGQDLVVDGGLVGSVPVTAEGQGPR